MTLVVKILKRVLGAAFTLFAISVAVFLLASLTPGDQVETMLEVDGDKGGRTMTFEQRREQYQRTAEELDQYGPAFYFSIMPSHWPDTLWKIIPKQERVAARELLIRSGNWSEVQAYRQALASIVGSAGTDVTSLSGNAQFLLVSSSVRRSDFYWNEIRNEQLSDPALLKEVDNAFAIWKKLKADRPSIIPIPRFVWYGARCRYHKWISSLVKGDFGRSIVDGRTADKKVREAIQWTLRINITTILLAFGISIPLGLAMAKRNESRFDRWMSQTLFIFYAIPSFWLGTLLIVFLTTPEYASWLDLFPAGGVGDYYFTSGWKKSGIIAISLVLPVLSLLLGSLAYISRQMRDSVIRESRKDYVRMARAKGLSEKEIYRKHILRNSLFPMITLAGAALPASVSGSVIIEVLFGIPGMGRLMYSSILSQDWSVVYVMVLVAAFLTIVGYLLSDIVYQIADPRLSTTQKPVR